MLQCGGRARTGFLLAASLVSGAAAADPGDHIHLGAAEITPAVQVATEISTNAYLENGAEGNEPDLGVALRLHPNLGASLSNDDLDFQLDAGWSPRIYVTTGMKNLNRYSDFNLLVGLDSGKNALVGFKGTEDLRNRARATDVGDSDNPDAATPPDSTIHRLYNKSLAQLSIHPGGALSVDVGGHFIYDRYTFPESAIVGDEPGSNYKYGYGPNLDVLWNFFPKTAVVMDGYLDVYNWTPNTRVGNDGSVNGLPDGNQWRLTAGLKGRITDTVLVSLMAGYGQLSPSVTSVTSESSAVDVTAIEESLKGFPDGLIGIAEVSYQPSPNHKFTLGARREFSDVYFTNYVEYGSFTGRYEGRYFDRLKTLGEVAFRLENYVGEVTRNDNYARVRLDLAYELTPYLDLGAGAIYSNRTNVDGSAPGVDYTDVSVLLGVTFLY